MADYQIAALGFAMLNIFFIILESHHIKKLITPYSLTALPFIVIVLISNFFLIDLDFPPITLRTQFFIQVQLLIFVFASFSISQFFDLDKIPGSKKYSKPADEFSSNVLLLIALSWFSILIIFRKVLSLFSAHGGWIYFGDPEYELQMISGFHAHITQLAKVCFIFLVMIYKKANYKKAILITLAGLFFAVAIIQIKYHILWLVLMAFIFINAEETPKKQIKNLAWAGFVLLLIFNLFWIALKIAWGNFGFSNVHVYEYIAKQTANYLATGSMLLDNWLNHPNVRPDWTVITVLKNIHNLIVGNRIMYDFVPMVSLGFTRIGPGISSNVGTAFGTYYIIGGWWLTLAYSIITSIVYYIIYFISYTRYNLISIFFNLLFLTITTLTFFGTYYNSLSTYEMPIVFILLVLMLKLINHLKEIRVT